MASSIASSSMLGSALSSGNKDRCKFCKRVFSETPNPIKNLRDVEPILQRRRQRGLECSICPRYHNKHRIGQAKPDIEKETNTDEGLQKYMEGLNMYEEQINEEVISKSNKRKMNESGHETPNEKVNVVDANMFKFRKNCGVFWPLPLLELHRKEKPEDTEVQTIKFGKDLIRGIFLDASQGEPIGTITFSHENIFGGEKKSTASDSRTAVDSAEVSNVMDNIHTRMAIKNAAETGTKNQETGSYEIVSHRMVLKNKRKKQQDDNDLLDDLWDDDLLKGSNKSSSRASASGVNRDVEGETPGKAAGKGAKKTKAGQDKGSKVFNAIQTTEKVVLDARQLLDKIANTDTFALVTGKQCEAMLKKLTDRDTATLIELYTSEQAGVQGTSLMENMRTFKRKIAQALELIQVFAQKDAPKVLLMGAVIRAKSEGINIPESHLREVTLQGELAPSFAAGDYTALAKMLSGTREDATLSFEDPDATVNLCSLAPEYRLPFQKHCILGHLSSLLKDPSSHSELDKYLQTMVAHVLCESLKQELQGLQKIIFPMEDSVSKEDLLRWKKKFQNDKSLMLHKAVVFFKGGEALLENVDKALLQRTDDEKLVSRLSTLSASMREVPILDDDGPVSLGANERQWKQIADEYYIIKTKASPYFCQRHSEAMRYLSDRIIQAQVLLSNGANLIFNQICSQECEKIHKLLQKSKNVSENVIKENLQVVKLCLNQILTEGILDATKTGYASIVPAKSEEFKRYRELQGVRHRFITDLLAGIPALYMRTLSLQGAVCDNLARAIAIQASELGLTYAVPLEKLLSECKTAIATSLELALAQDIPPLSDFILFLSAMAGWAGEAISSESLGVSASARGAIAKLDSTISKIDKTFNFFMASDSKIKVKDMHVPACLLPYVPKCFNMAVVMFSVIEFVGTQSLECDSLIETLLPQLENEKGKLSNTAMEPGKSVPDGVSKMLEAAAFIKNQKAVWISQLLKQELEQWITVCDGSIAVGSPIHDLKEQASEDVTDTQVANSLFQAISTPQARTLYKTHKFIKSGLVLAESEEFKSILKGLDDTLRQNVEEVIASASSKLEVYLDSVSISMVSQAIWRTLKPGETRANLALRAKDLTKKQRLPPNLNMLLCQLAGDGQQANA